MVLETDDGQWELTFPDVAELESDGSLMWGRVEGGWEVMDTSMLVADSPRGDGRKVYLLWLPRFTLNFASGECRMRPLGSADEVDHDRAV